MMFIIVIPPAIAMGHIPAMNKRLCLKLPAVLYFTHPEVLALESNQKIKVLVPEVVERY